MLIGEPPRTQADLNFRVLGIPVRIHPFFWLITLLLGVSSADQFRNRQGVIALLIWFGVVLVSILVHELGHALMARKFGWPPKIVLHGFGGLAIYRPTYDDPKKQILISLAGPVAGFLFLGVILAGLAIAGRPITFRLGGSTGITWNLASLLGTNMNAIILVHQLIFVNLFWGLINLLPVYPLDGGRVAREALTINNPREGMMRSLWLSVITGAVIAVFAIVLLNQLYLALLFGYLAFLNYRVLQQYRSSYGGYGGYDEDRNRW